MNPGPENRLGSPERWQCIEQLASAFASHISECTPRLQDAGAIKEIEMKKLIATAMAIAIILTVLVPAALSAQRRKVVVHNHPHRKTLVVRRNYPIRRRLPATVVVRPPGDLSS